jgi:hypothetical protein
MNPLINLTFSSFSLNHYLPSSSLLLTDSPPPSTHPHSLLSRVWTTPGLFDTEPLFQSAPKQKLHLHIPFRPSVHILSSMLPSKVIRHRAPDSCAVSADQTTIASLERNLTHRHIYICSPSTPWGRYLRMTNSTNSSEQRFPCFLLTCTVINSAATAGSHRRQIINFILSSNVHLIASKSPSTAVSHSIELKYRCCHHRCTFPTRHLHPVVNHCRQIEATIEDIGRFDFLSVLWHD